MTDIRVGNLHTYILFFFGNLNFAFTNLSPSRLSNGLFLSVYISWPTCINIIKDRRGEEKRREDKMKKQSRIE